MGWQVLLKAALQNMPLQHVPPEPHEPPWTVHATVGWQVVFAALHVVPGQHACVAHERPCAAHVV
jgi:hypothetical protein